VQNLANIKSSKKRILVNAKKAARNKSNNTALKTALKKAYSAIENDSADKAELVKDAEKKIDRAVVKGILHKNNAARKKSALAKKANG
jgi:small subunit ribosomal protein S20